MSEACVAFALAREAAPFRARGRVTERFADAPCPAYRLVVGGGPVLVLETGVGPKRVRAAWAWLGRRGVGSLISAGYCGSLDPAIPVGSVVRPSEVITTDGRTFGTNLSPPDGPRLLTTDRLIATAAEKSALRTGHGADLVDMESAVWAEWCRAAGVAFGVVRAVSDGPDDEIPPGVLGLLGRERVSAWRFASSLGRRPWELPSLARLGIRSSAAGRNLARALAGASD